MEEDAVIPQAAPQHGKIKGSIMGHQQAAVQNGTNGFPKHRKGGGLGDHFRSNAGEGCVEGGKRRLGIDKKGIFLGNGTGFDDGNADGADPVIGVIGCFYVEGDVPLAHQSVAS